MLLAKSDWTSILRSVSRPGDETTYLLASGFQRLKLPTAIPMRKLVLLYGPNSAGKGTVLDVLSMLNSLWADGIEGQTDSLARRWQRNDGAVPLSVGFSMAISQRAWFASIGARKFQYIDFTDEGMIPRPTSMDSTERRITWRATWESATSTTIDTGVCFDVFIGESLLASIRSSPDGDKMTFTIMGAQFADFLGALGPYIPDPEGDLFEGTLPENPEFRCDYLKSFSSYVPSRKHSDTDELIRLIFAVPLFIFAGDFIAEDPSYLGPLRWVPRADELRLWETPPEEVGSTNCHFDYLCKDTDKSAPTSTRANSFVDRPNDGSYAWRMLAAHFAVSVDRSQSSYSEETESSFVDETGSEDIADGPRIDAPQETEESLIDQINRWLDHDEFFGTGYRITAELSQFVAVASSEKSGPDGLERGKSDIRDRMVTFTLVDDAGRKLEFRDVGTGFSQVLPVIICCAVHESITILEQPELHLHPRLQTKLLDLFLESINKSRRALALTQIGNSESSYADALLLADRRKSLIVESHSEHIILRLMRRIRESSSADIKHTRLHVKPSDVAVIYFEPEGDETYVHLLELTDDGAFADRWPHGFFDERFEEFFDE